MGCLQQKDWRDLVTARTRVTVAHQIKQVIVNHKITVDGNKYAHAFARQLEENAYGNATSIREYFYLIAMKIASILRELDKKYKGTEDE